MTESDYACPHCQGDVRVAAVHAGLQVCCPLCQGAFIVPRETGTTQRESPFEPVRTEAFHFECPICNSAFPVTAASLGRNINCPKCSGNISLPAAQTKRVEPNLDSAGMDSKAISSKTFIEPPDSADESIPAQCNESRSGESTLPDSPKGTSHQRVLPGESCTHGESQSLKDTANHYSTPVTLQSLNPTKSGTASKLNDGLPPRFTLELPPAWKSEFPGNTATGTTDSIAPLTPMRTSGFVRVFVDGKEHVLRKLPPEEIARRKAVRNVLLFTIGGLLLAFLARLLLRN